jgi:hypothetical protein
MKGNRPWDNDIRHGRADESPPVTRWRDRPPGGARAEDHVANLLRQALPPTGLDARAHDRVLRRLRGRPSRRPTRVVLRWALPAVILFSSGAVVASVGIKSGFGRWLSNALSPRPTIEQTSRRSSGSAPIEKVIPAPSTSPGLETDTPARAPRLERTEAETDREATSKAATANPPQSLRPRAFAPSSGTRVPPVRKAVRTLAWTEKSEATPTPTPAAPAALDPAGEIATARPLARTAAPPPALAPVPALAPPPVQIPAPSALALEASLLKRAVVSLRRGSPAQALVDLDGYLVRFPGGVLRREARVARVDALLALGDESEALLDLEQLTFGGHGRDLELRTIRAELLAKRSCAEAIADFSAVIEASPRPSLAERALRGRVTCRLRTEDENAAEDVATYVRRFPKGRFAREARALLDAAAR